VAARIDLPWRGHVLVAKIATAAGRRARDDADADATAAASRPLWRAPAAAAAEQAGARLLVAEDNPVNRAVIGKLLDTLGLVVTFATDGENAWELLQAERFGLLMTDCHMPGLDGYGLTRRLRQAETDGGRAGRLPVLALTADARPEIDDQCRAVGMDGVLMKPLDRDAIDAAITRLLPSAVALRQRTEPAPADTPPAPAKVVSDGTIDFAMLEATFGSARARSMLGLFVTSVRPYIDTLDQALASGALQDGFHAAHAAKGSALLIGAKDLAEVCGAIEAALRDGDLARARDRAPDLKPRFAAVETLIGTLSG
jgi:CheY-like chemotaxis protein/HPt (histidine-containing phosphotransfer) domain-containing protein